jgi:tRNA (guanine37-N1)-methyltransferase
MHISILTLFPEMFPGVLGSSLTGEALKKGLWHLEAINIRDFATDKHKTVDDTPFGGGAGMLMKADIIEAALLSIPADQRGKCLYLSPRGKPLTHARAQALSAESALTLLCGRYEGVDQRVLDAYGFEEVSIGDYVLTGGELPAMVLLDAVLRLKPGVLGNQATHDEESFYDGLLEYPHYTRPANWLDKQGVSHHTPAVLLSGHHAEIRQWRQNEAETLTAERRPDLWQAYKQRKNNKITGQS